MSTTVIASTDSLLMPFQQITNTESSLLLIRSNIGANNKNNLTITRSFLTLDTVKGQYLNAFRYTNAL